MEAINFVGVSENFQSSILNIVPNPVTDFFTIQLFTFNAGDSFTVMDAMGRIVLQQNITSKEMVMDAGAWESGVYEVR
ncbi:MAG: T9SS type A sorting domain-containing protein [Flavobacteriales bacterium]|nr:T9SS type A sorting domain-containing protein [Flavobacteriales bacterium]